MTDGNPIEGYWLVPIACFACASLIGWFALAQARRIERRLERDRRRTRIVAPLGGRRNRFWGNQC